jgi:hypothetical protein
MLRILIIALALFLAVDSGMAQQRPLAGVERAMRELNNNLCRSLRLAKCRVPVARARKPDPAAAAKPPAPRVAAREPRALPLPRQRPRSLVSSKSSLPKGTSAAAAKSVNAMEKQVLGDMTEIAAAKKRNKDQSRIAGPLRKLEPDDVKTATLKPPKPVERPKKAPSPVVAAEKAAPDCTAILELLGATYKTEATPASTSNCAIVNPVRVLSVKTAAGTVAFTDQPLLNCAFAAEFVKWTRDTAAPLAKAATAKALTAISTGPGFDCRGRNGDATAKISEHASGNAVDIERFQLADGYALVVKNAGVVAAPDRPALQALRGSACPAFTTVLGPGSNTAHEEHFHFDLGQHGRSGTYRICQ